MLVYNYFCLVSILVFMLNGADMYSRLIDNDRYVFTTSFLATHELAPYYQHLYTPRSWSGLQLSRTDLLSNRGVYSRLQPAAAILKSGICQNRLRLRVLFPDASENQSRAVR
jgi:hypothetical protein